ncbi:MAG: hypothetical protein ACK56I_17645, partial [bacterium]
PPTGHEIRHAVRSNHHAGHAEKCADDGECPGRGHMDAVGPVHISAVRRPLGECSGRGMEH